MSDQQGMEKENDFVCDMESGQTGSGDWMGANSVRTAASGGSWKGRVCARIRAAARLRCNSVSRLAPGSGEEQSANRGRTARLASGQTSSHARADVARPAVRAAAFGCGQRAALRG